MKYKDMSWVVGNIGYCLDSNLRIGSSGGHYVYIHSIDKYGKCVVSTLTSLEDDKGNFKLDRILKIRKGIIFAFPKHKTNLKLWTGFNSNKIYCVDVNNIFNIGVYWVAKDCVEAWKILVLDKKNNQH